MKLKQVRHIGIFLLLTLGIHLGLKALNLPGSIAALAFIPVIYAVFHLVKCIIYLFKHQKRAALNSFTTALLFGLIFHKFFYAYYNLLLSILVLIYAAWITRLAWKGNDENSKKNKVTLLALLILNAILTLLPDERILQYLNPGELSWRTLTWENFEGTPIDTSSHDAQTAERINYRINKAYNYPPAIVSAGMNPKNSWVKLKYKNNSTDGLELLEHELGHFNITEFYARKIQDSISTYWGEPEKVEAIIQYWAKENDSMQNVYDDFTKHGRDTIQQHVWTNFMTKQLSNNRVSNSEDPRNFVSDIHRNSFNNKPIEVLGAMDTTNWKLITKDNFTIHYPNNWELYPSTDSNTALMIVSPFDSTISSRVGIDFSIIYFDQNFGIDSYVKIIEKSFEEHYEKINLLEKRKIRIGLNNYYLILLGFVKDNFEYRTEVCFFIVGKKSYLFRVLTHAEVFDRYRKEAETIMGTLTLNP